MVISGLIMGAIGRYIALKVMEETGTANLTFIIVVAGTILIYVLFIALAESLQQVAKKKSKPEQELSSEPSEVSAFQQKIDVFCLYSDNILK